MANSIEMHPRVLVVDDDLSPSKVVEQVGGRRIRDLLAELKEYGNRIVEAGECLVYVCVDGKGYISHVWGNGHI